MSTALPQTDHESAQPTAVALVTAGSRRIGKAIALSLARLGYDIALHYNSSASEAADTAQEIQSMGRRCQTFQRDFSDFAQVLSLLPDVRAQLGAPSLLVNSASVYEAKNYLASSPDDFDINFNLHVKVPYFLTSELAKHCSSNGLVINMIDTGVINYKTNYFPYLLSKKTLLELTKMAASELAPHVRVNAIAPGLVRPPKGQEQGHEKHLDEKQWQSAVTVADIIIAVEYLVNNRVVTGQCLFIDHGRCVDF